MKHGVGRHIATTVPTAIVRKRGGFGRMKAPELIGSQSKRLNLDETVRAV